MKILLVDQFAELGGAQRCLLDLVTAMHPRGWQPSVALPSQGPLSDLLKRQQTPVGFFACGPYRSGRKTLLDMGRFAYDVASARRTLRELMVSQKPDLVYVNGPRPLPAAALAAGRRVPLIFHVHSHLPPPYANRLAGWSLRSSTATVIASCEFLGQPVRAYVPPERFHVIYNGIRELPFVPRQFSTKPQWTIGVVGRVAPEKGQTDFLRAARIVSGHVPGSRFVICGAPMFSDAAYWHSVQELAGGLPVEFLGWREDMGAVLSRLDLLVVPSAAIDGTTRVILEAYSAGVPVVAYPSGGIREVIDHGGTGFLTQSNDPESLASTLLDVMQKPGCLFEITRQARQAWEEKYTLDRYCRQVLEAIESAVRPSSTRNSTAASSARSAAIPNTGE
jgi:glycosyltransferase involved in cell wall biosynthesis